MNRFRVTLLFLMLANLLLSAPAAADITTGLLAYYPFDGTAADGTGNGHDGTETAITYGAGKFDRAAGFNNTSSVVTVPGLAGNLPANLEPRSVALWVYLTDNVDNGNLVTWGDLSTGQRFSLLYQGSRRLDLIGQFNDHISSATLPLNTWAHVVVTYDGGTIRFYMDGAAVGSSAASLSTSGALPLRIGANVFGGEAEYFGGALDEVRIYDRVLSASDVSELYAATPASSAAAPIPTLSEWGMMIMFGLLCGSMLYTMRKKKQTA